MDMGVHMKTWKYVAYHLINKLLDNKMQNYCQAVS